MIYVYLKVKFTLEQAMKAQTESSSSTTMLDGGEWSTPLSNRFTPGKEQVPIVQEAGLALGPVHQLQKISTPLRFNFQTAQRTASHYTNYIIPAHPLCTYLTPTNFRLHLCLTGQNSNHAKDMN